MDCQNKLFEELSLSKTVNDIEKLFKKYDIERKDRVKYPDIDFCITTDEIDELKKTGIITEENQFSQDLSKNKKLTPLEKIF